MKMNQNFLVYNGGVEGGTFTRRGTSFVGQLTIDDEQSCTHVCTHPRLN